MLRLNRLQDRYFAIPLSKLASDAPLDRASLAQSFFVRCRGDLVRLREPACVIEAVEPILSHTPWKTAAELIRIFRGRNEFFGYFAGTLFDVQLASFISVTSGGICWLVTYYVHPAQPGPWSSENV